MKQRSRPPEPDGPTIPSPAIALAATGFTKISIPLPTVLPQGVAGCEVLTSPDLLDVLLPTTGVVQTQVALPNTASIVGQSFHHQVVSIELDAMGSFLALTSTNGLTLTIGWF